MLSSLLVFVEDEPLYCIDIIFRLFWKWMGLHMCMIISDEDLLNKIENYIPHLNQE